MNKPLSEWTLGEIKAECKRCAGNCIDAICPMVKWISKDEAACVIMHELRKSTPASWDLSAPPRWAEQDKEDAKAVRHLMPWATKVGRGRDYDSLMLNSSVGLHRDLFPSLKPGESATLDEIIGGGE